MPHHHTTSGVSVCCSKDVPGSTACHPALEAEQRLTQGRAESLQPKVLVLCSCRILQITGVFPRKPIPVLTCSFMISKTENSLRTEIKYARDNRTQGWASYKISWQNLCVFYTSIVSRQPKKKQTASSVPALPCLYPTNMVKELRAHISFLSVKPSCSPIV